MPYLLALGYIEHSFGAIWFMGVLVACGCFGVISTKGVGGHFTFGGFEDKLGEVEGATWG